MTFSALHRQLTEPQQTQRVLLEGRRCQQTQRLHRFPPTYSLMHLLGRRTCVVSTVDDGSHRETQGDAELGPRRPTTSWKEKDQLDPRRSQVRPAAMKPAGPCLPAANIHRTIHGVLPPLRRAHRLRSQHSGHATGSRPVNQRTGGLFWRITPMGTDCSERLSPSRLTNRKLTC